MQKYNKKKPIEQNKNFVWKTTQNKNLSAMSTQVNSKQS